MKNILFLIFLFLMSCGTSIKQIEVKEISDVQFMGIEDNQIILKSELNLYNPNTKNLRASQVYSKIYFNAKFFGEFENLDKIILKKNNFTKINCLIPACKHSSNIYSKFGLPLIGNNSFGITLDRGNNLVPNPANGIIAWVTIKTFYKLNKYFTNEIIYK